jgi:hypothetical protein
MAPDRTLGSAPVASSFELRVLGAYSRHILKGMRRIDVETDGQDLLTTAFADAENQTLVMLNRGVQAMKVTIHGNTGNWNQMERTGLEENNSVSAAPAEVVVEPGEIVVLSTVIAEN